MSKVFSYLRTAKQNYISPRSGYHFRKQKTTNIENVKSKRKKAYTHLICISLTITTMEICIEDLQKIKTGFSKSSSNGISGQLPRRINVSLSLAKQWDRHSNS